MQPETPEPDGEGAALIAATEQEIARITDCPEAMDAWEATARRLADDVDRMRPVVEAALHLVAKRNEHHGDPSNPEWWQGWDFDLVRAVEAHGAPVQAATHGEAGEAQTGVQGAARPANLGWAAPTEVRWDPKPAVQGAGRDWRGEIMQVLADRTGDTLEFWADEADAIVAALGLHDLEQAAEQWHDYWSQAVAERDTEARLRRSEIAEADKLAADLRAERDEALVDRDAARRELEQLRGEVGKIAKDASGRVVVNGLTLPTHALGEIAHRLRTLAAAAPATQDGSQPQGACEHGLPWKDMAYSHYSMHHKEDHP